MTRDEFQQINAKDFGIPPLFAERAENYARWAAAAEREACAKLADEADKYNRHISREIAAAIRARGET